MPVVPDAHHSIRSDADPSMLARGDQSLEQCKSIINQLVQLTDAHKVAATDPCRAEWCMGARVNTMVNDLQVGHLVALFEVAMLMLRQERQRVGQREIT